MEGKLYSFYTIIYIMIRVCRSQYAMFRDQPHPLAFHVAPGIQSFSNPYRSLSRSEGATLFLGGPFSGSYESPLMGAPLTLGTIVMPAHLGTSSFPKRTIPDTQSGSEYNDPILFPSGKPHRTQNVSPPVTKKPNSNIKTNCIIENAEIDYGGKCYLLLNQGPCSANHWLIVNKNEEPYCDRRPCQKGKLKYNGRCVDISDTSVCGTSEILYVEFTGEVYCDCLPHYVYDTEKRKCFEENKQGSCPFGQFLDLDSNNNLRCIENLCKRDDLVYNPKDKSCYKKDYVGACKETGYEIFYNDKSRIALCVSVNNKNIFEVPALTSCPAGSRRDFFGKCKKVLRINQNGPHALRVPSQQVSRYSQCPPGLSKYPDGSCRKVNDLLGR